ncbi:MAG TPA: hypothetical protein VMF30_13120 [Pirellulales bacterium]|nr:hypothetical protein [Pirellulales bacterium]
MEIISTQECREWVSSNLGAGFTLEAIRSEFPRWFNYRLPAATSRKTAIARALSSDDYVIDTRRPGLFWITEWGVSYEIPAIFYGYRKSLGEDRQLIDAPGHVFHRADLQQLECLLGLSLYFYWDAILFDGSGTVAFGCDHHEWLSVYAKTEDRLRSVMGMLEPYELEEVRN